MTETSAARRQVWTALAAIAVMVFLLLAVGIWSWRGADSMSPTPAPPQPFAGPLSKVSVWVEPPPPKWQDLDLYILTKLTTYNVNKRVVLISEQEGTLETNLRLKQILVEDVLQTIKNAPANR